MRVEHDIDAVMRDLASTDKMGQIKKTAKSIGRDHELAMALWQTGVYRARLLSALVLDNKLLDIGVIERLATDLAGHDLPERNQVSDWLLANQLSKLKRTRGLVESWKDHPSPVLRRLFWYHQARLRWTGRTPPGNTPDLLEALESTLGSEVPEVQWAMNFAAGWIGVHEPKHRGRCVELGKRHGLYKGEKVSRGCTPSYLPEFNRIEASKLERP